MTLPTFETIDQVPEPFRPFYREQDGKLVPDLVPGAEVVGLKRNAQTLLDEKKALQQRYADVDPDEYRALKASGKSVKDLDERLKAAAEEKAKLEQRLQAVESKYKTSAKTTEITRALAAENASVDLLLPVVERFVDVDDDGHVIVKTADGGVRYKDGAGNRFTVSDLLAELKTKPAYQPAFSVKVGSGGGATPGGAPSGVRLIDPNDKAAMVAGIADIRAGKAKVAG